MKKLIVLFACLFAHTTYACLEMNGDYQITDLRKQCKTAEQRMPGYGEDIDWYLPEHESDGNLNNTGYISENSVLTISADASCKKMKMSYLPVTVDQGLHHKLFNTTYAGGVLMSKTSDSDGVRTLKVSVLNKKLRLLVTYGPQSRSLALDCSFPKR